MKVDTYAGLSMTARKVVGSIPAWDIELLEAVLVSKWPQNPDMSSDLNFGAVRNKPA